MNEKNTTAPLVSVVIPSFNHSQFIEQTICSVLSQTYARLQLIVVDDGSSDGSAPLLQRLSEKLKFDLLIQENRGVCATLNRGIRERARGEWIAILGSDDLWRRDKIELQMLALAAQPGSKFCYAQARAFMDGSLPETGRIFPRRVFDGQLLKRVFFRQHVPAGTMLFSRNLYDSLGGFDETLREEDWDWVIRCAASTRFSSVAEPLLLYRLHPESTMRKSDPVVLLHQKLLLLSKNFRLVSPLYWLTAVLTHFVFNLLILPIKRKFDA
ncbi:MAG: glycosyltransferase [Sphingomonadales bacterium]|nr:glycosyltransferase [Sphingomonadales bacterium]MBK9004873.1 glycosyltransferase [Sphingomonadales bacterium]MBK9267397.1 glycosyltransferase [Sphingomonadales bacterium]